MLPVVPPLRLPPSGVAGGLEPIDFLPCDFLPSFFAPFFAPDINEATAMSLLFDDFYALFFTATFLPPLTLAAEVFAATLFALGAPRLATLVVPSLNCHSPQELTRMP